MIFILDHLLWALSGHPLNSSHNGYSSSAPRILHGNLWPTSDRSAKSDQGTNPAILHANGASLRSRRKMGDTERCLDVYDVDNLLKI